MKRLLCVLLVLLLLFGGARPASATAPTPQMYWDGVQQAGVIPTDNECPIKVESMLLTFDLQEFANPYYTSSEEDLAAYTGKVTTQYTFYNPTNTTITTKLLFPFGLNNWHEEIYDKDAQKYQIQVDGETVAATIRHTPHNDQFSFNYDLPLVSDNYLEDPFYSPDTTVTYYRFLSQVAANSDFADTTVAFDIPKGTGNRQFIIPPDWYGNIQENGDLRVFLYTGNNDTEFGFYVIGDPLEALPEFSHYKDRNANEGDRLSGCVSSYGTTTMTFEEFVLGNWDEETGVSKTDWYNISLVHLKQNTHPSHPITYRVYPSYRAYLREIMRWYEYEITLEPGQKIINTVTAPIYPFVDEHYEPTLYGCTYLFSPTSTWKSFEILDVVINTPYYMTNSSLDGFQKTDTGYRASFDELPTQSLSFELSASENPEKVRDDGESLRWIYVLILIIAPFVYIAQALESVGEFITELFQNLF